MLVARTDVLALVQEVVDAVNSTLAPFERIRRFALLPSEFTIAGGEVTPTMKVKRRAVEERWRAVIETRGERAADGSSDDMIDLTVRIYGPLNDFLPSHRRQVPWRRLIDAPTSVKDLIESLGVPHPEIDLILVNGGSVDFDYIVRTGDRIAVFPRFLAVDIGMLTRVRPRPLGAIRFVVDVHLGRLARHLRLVGLDTAYRHDADDAVLADTADRERRILLTRDHVLLKRRTVAHGYFVRETHPHSQFVEVLRRFGPLELRPFSRCLRCNGVLRDVPKSAVDTALLPRTRQHYDSFRMCSGCSRVYWKGSHWKRLTQAVDAAREEAERGAI